MVVEPERVMCDSKSVVRSSNHLEGMSLLIQATLNPSKNLIHSRKRIITHARVGHCRQLSMSMKALRAESRKCGVGFRLCSFDIMQFGLLSSRANVDLIRNWYGTGAWNECL